MRARIVTMLNLQDSMNRKVHADWIAQHFAWYRAAWIECGELIDHYGYKWWKKQTPDMEQVRLEIVDIWHFGMSMLLDGRDVELIASDIEQTLATWQPRSSDVLVTTEAMALSLLQTRSFDVALFWDLAVAAGLDFDALFRAYVGKNVLNFFRQDHGYKDGTYVKLWQGREDNEHLSELLTEVDAGDSNFAQTLYAALQSRYKALTAIS
jgi:dimeric dUTPase (all-alpha-NTP-PPase superfamily)